LDIPLISEFLGEPSKWSVALSCVVLLIAIVSFVFLSFVSFFESEFFSLSTTEIAEIKISNDSRYHRLKMLSEDLLFSLGTVIVMRYTLIVSALTTASLSLYEGLVKLLGVDVGVGFLIILLILLMMIFVFAELIPERMANKENPNLLCWSARLLYFFGLISRPLVKSVIKTTNVVERRLESRTQTSAAIEDISDSLNLSDAESDEKEILRGVMNFGKINVDEIMRPRVDVVDVDYRSDFAEVLKIVCESEYSRLPVYDDSIDDVKGILYVKDFFRHTDKGKDFNWRTLIREAYFVPENKKVDDLLKEFQQKHTHMAIVVDEFGGTSGIVTMEDIIEVIVGDICDEHDEEEIQINALEDGSFVLDGKLLLTDFYRLDRVKKDDFDDLEGDVDTLAGLILEIMGYIPSIGEVIEYNNYIFEILSADGRRIKEVKMKFK
jgi:gliding motility-associated protein GldE